jgi:preprotein translocase subunit Sss1
MDIMKKTALGFIVMGFIGFFVKLLFIVSPSSKAGGGA